MRHFNTEREAETLARTPQDPQSNPNTLIKLIANRLAEFTDEYDATDGTGYIAYNRRLDYLIEHDES